MKTQPVRPAPAAAAAPGDSADFLSASGLPGRWAGRERFVVLQTHFGAGHHFLATWHAWLRDPARCQRLVFVGIDNQPHTAAQAAESHRRSSGTLPLDEPGDLAEQLVAAWPPLTPNVHVLDFEAGRVQLLLAWGDLNRLLPTLNLQADALAFSTSSPADEGLGSAQMGHTVQALARKAATGATLVSRDNSPALQRSLRTAGYALDATGSAGDSQTHLRAVYRPLFTPSRAPAAPTPAQAAAAPPPRTALVVGAGLAGAAAADGLRRQGLLVTVLDRRAEPAGGASGNPAGLVHGTVNPDDGPYARLFRAAALLAASSYAPVAQQCPENGAMRGLLRLEMNPGGLASMQAQKRALGLPDDYVQALDAKAASRLAGLPLAAPAWHYPSGGWVRPAAWVQQVLNQPGVGFQGHCAVARIERHAGLWHACAGDGSRLAAADVLVLACSAQTADLLAPWLPQPWPLRATLGQVTQGRAFGEPHGLKLPLAGDGYAIPLPQGEVLCGATREDAAAAAADTLHPETAEAHRYNADRLQRLCGVGLEPGLTGRSAARLHTDDRLPIAGALAVANLPPGTRRDQARLLPRVPGLLVLTALGARGLTLAPLLGRLVAAQATGAPWPLEQDLADAVDPARWRVRAARKGGAQEPSG